MRDGTSLTSTSMKKVQQILHVSQWRTRMLHCNTLILLTLWFWWFSGSKEEREVYEKAKHNNKIQQSGEEPGLHLKVWLSVHSFTEATQTAYVLLLELLNASVGTPMWAFKAARAQNMFIMWRGNASEVSATFKQNKQAGWRKRKRLVWWARRKHGLLLLRTKNSTTWITHLWYLYTAVICTFRVMNKQMSG